MEIRIGQVWSGFDENMKDKPFMKIQITRIDEDGYFRFRWTEGPGVKNLWTDDTYGDISQWPSFLKLDEHSNVTNILSQYES